MRELYTDVEKVFFAYGDPPFQEAARIINERAAAVKEIVLKMKPGEPILQFGETRSGGYPKNLGDLEGDDIESEVIL